MNGVAESSRREHSATPNHLVLRRLRSASKDAPVGADGARAEHASRRRASARLLEPSGHRGGAVPTLLLGSYAHRDGARRAHRLCEGHDPAPSSGRPRRPCFSHRRLVLRLPRLLPVDPAGPEIQLPFGPAADRRGAAVCDQGAAVHPRRGGGVQADPSRHHFRQDGKLVPTRHLPGLQGSPEGSPRRTAAAVPADARHRLGLRHGADRAGPLRGRRHHRHLRPPGARGERRRSHRFRRQGPHAARRAGRVDVRPGFGRPRGAALRRRGSRQIFRGSRAR